MFENYQTPKRLLKRRYQSLKLRAKKKKIDFSISVEYLDKIMNEPCYYCGIFKLGLWGMSIDRQDSKDGYTNKNCVSACLICNSKKNIKTLNEFGEHLEKIR